MADFKNALTSHYWKPIAPLLDDERIADIFIDRYNRIYTSSAQGYVDFDGGWETEADFVRALGTLKVQSNLDTLDANNPSVDMRLPDGSRVAASIQPLAQHPHATIRVTREKSFSLKDLLGLAMLSDDMASYLQSAIRGYRNIIVSGATNSGKTSLMRALLEPACAVDRLFVIEDTRELRLPIKRGVSHEITAGNQASLEMVDSLKTALRSAPDRLVIGEIRDSKSLLAYLEALEAGFRGGITSMHAPSARGAMWRAVRFLQRTGLFAMAEPYIDMVFSNIDLVVHCARCEDKQYRVLEIAEIHDDEINLMFAWDQEKGRFVRKGVV